MLEKAFGAQIYFRTGSRQTRPCPNCRQLFQPDPPYRDPKTSDHLPIPVMRNRTAVSHSCDSRQRSLGHSVGLHTTHCHTSDASSIKPWKDLQASHSEAANTEICTGEDSRLDETKSWAASRSESSLMSDSTNDSSDSPVGKVDCAQH